MWAFFEYDVDERGNPLPKKVVRTESAQPALSVSAAQEEERRKEVRRKEDRLRSALPPEQRARIRSLRALRENLQNAMTSVEEELSTLHQTTGGGGIQEDK